MTQSGPLFEPRSFQRDYEGTAESLRATRDDVSAWLRDRDCDDEMAEDAVLVASELASNAVQAAPAHRYAVSIVDAGPGLVELTVRSAFHSVGLPERSSWFPTTPSSPSGRGLSIVAALSIDVRVDIDSEHVRVTAILSTATTDRAIAPAADEGSSSVERIADTDELDLFRAYARTQRRVLRNELVERYMGLAVHIAKRYWRNGSEDDVRQAAMIGLIKAVDRFDPEQGVSFVTFAGSTIEGELKRYLRDRTWVLRVPRSAKELHLQVRRASDELLQRHGRSPSVTEVAAHLQVPTDDVLRGLAATAAYDVGSIDGSSDPDAVPTNRSRALAAPDRSIDHIMDAEVVERLLGRLPEREREIVRLHFFEEQSQAQVGELMGISQMHVSRLLRRSFETMRAWMNEGPGER